MNVALDALFPNREPVRAGAGGLGRMLVEQGALAPADLLHALAEQETSGAPLGEVLIAGGWATAEQVTAALAEQWRVGATDLTHDPPEKHVGNPIMLDSYLKHSIVPWRRIGQIEVLTTSRPETAAAAMAELSPEHGLAFVTLAPRQMVDQALLDRFGPELAERAAQRTAGPESVRTLDSMRFGAVTLWIAVLAGVILAPGPALALAGVALLLLNGATTLTRTAALIAGGRAGPEPIPEPAIALHRRRKLPKISLLVPLYREAVMIGPLAEALPRLDYPRALMDVKLLLESDDTETLAAARAADLPAWIQPLVLPPGEPRTKPRALNLALDFCEGEIIGILDAEDQPEPSQLRSVAETFATAPPQTACVQCLLTWYNARENWITRCFQIEYAIWFDVLLRGFQHIGLPIPLGGTSVYFRRSVLRDVGGWDAHNVTEDADLGMRLARRGFHTSVIRSTTEEEASCRPIAWIRQRSRWLKGYLMTWLCHMRSPVQLWRELGPLGFFGLNVLFLGGAVTYLAMPLFWIALAMTLISGESVFRGHLPGWAELTLGTSLVLGQLAMLICAMVALRRRGMIGMIGWVPTLPLYWTLGAMAAWKALIELAVAPYYWDKTSHGVSRMAESGPDQAKEDMPDEILRGIATPAE
ncbi:MAG TPA: glycosyltransferase family 2 protein, partial [Paracoccaceae bacterium]|nr:glycosyltransferase family 2 protein [Paracoccaceae bacterium]